MTIISLQGPQTTPQGKLKISENILFKVHRHMTSRSYSESADGPALLSSYRKKLRKIIREIAFIAARVCVAEEIIVSGPGSRHFSE